MNTLQQNLSFKAHRSWIYNEIGAVFEMSKALIILLASNGFRNHLTFSIV